mmetsp:Transcript_7400/g.6672  ORF Transcript_7400/g.6672 Transcript_7400/m.6672 type:complete len:234 (-) Transcript_7400:138-839(-)
MILQSRPIRKAKLPEKELRHPFFYLAKNKWFDRFIYLCIVLNTIVLTVYWYDQDESLQMTIFRLNLMFAIVFTLESLVKLIGFGYVFFKDGWNIFDLIIVIITILGMVLSGYADIQLGPQTTIIRSFKIGRVLKYFRKNKSLQIIFQTFLITLPGLFNIGSLLFLIVFCYSILGINMFSEVKFGGINNELSNYFNFQNIVNSALTLLRVSTVGNWHKLMDACSQEHSIIYQCV